MKAKTPERGPVRGVTRPDALADQAYAFIRDAITSGRLSAGSKVTERSLAEQLGVSVTPVREALRQLEQDLLVERVGIRERRITELPGQTLRETLVIYAALRGVAARLAAQNATDEELRAMAAALEKAQSAAAGVPTAQALALFERFHALVDAAAHNLVLSGLMMMVRGFDPSYRARSVQEQVRTVPTSLADRVAHHQPILDAIRVRDADLADRLMREHTLEAGESYLRYSGSSPEASA
jgi:DNA-binding GntR family transcriptional regulator